MGNRLRLEFATRPGGGYADADLNPGQVWEPRFAMNARPPYAAFGKETAMAGTYRPTNPMKANAPRIQAKYRAQQRGRYALVAGAAWLGFDQYSVR